MEQNKHIVSPSIEDITDPQSHIDDGPLFQLVHIPSPKAVKKNSLLSLYDEQYSPVPSKRHTQSNQHTQHPMSHINLIPTHLHSFPMTEEYSSTAQQHSPNVRELQLVKEQYHHLYQKYVKLKKNLRLLSLSLSPSNESDQKLLQSADLRTMAESSPTDVPLNPSSSNPGDPSATSHHYQLSSTEAPDNPTLSTPIDPSRHPMSSSRRLLINENNQLRQRIETLEREKQSLQQAADYYIRKNDETDERNYHLQSQLQALQQQYEESVTTCRDYEMKFNDTVIELEYEREKLGLDIIAEKKIGKTLINCTYDALSVALRKGVISSSILNCPMN
jgi:hypothetical protein